MKKIMLIMLILAITIAMLGVSWGICCGLLLLISMCFGFDFSIKVATGIWLVLVLVNFFLGKEKNS